MSLTVNRRAGATAGRAVARTTAGWLAGYLLGTFPSADLAARAVTGRADHLRRHGSGNPGGLNATRVLGRRWGMAVIAADVAKGALATRFAGGGAGTAAVVGHCHPVWTRFRGGKGVATAAGQGLATDPAGLAVALAGAAAAARVPAPAGGRARRVAVVAAVVWLATASRAGRRDRLSTLVTAAVVLRRMGAGRS